MSWATDKKILTDALSDYKEIKIRYKANEAPTSRMHKDYVIVVGEPDITQIMNNDLVTVRRVILDINYQQKNLAAYDANVDDFESLKVTIAGLSPFVGFVTLTYPERWDDNLYQTTAKIEMFFGVMTT